MHVRQICSQIIRYSFSSSLVRTEGGANEMQAVPAGKVVSAIGVELFWRDRIDRLAWSGEKRRSRLGI